MCVLRKSCGMAESLALQMGRLRSDMRESSLRAPSQYRYLYGPPATSTRSRRG